MRVIIKDEIFDDENADHHMLGEIIAHGFEGRYSIFYSGEESSLAWKWRCRQSANSQAIWDLVFDSAKTEALNPSAVTLVIDVEGATNWNASPPVATLREAREFLRKPFKILVENATADKNFLLALANEENRKSLDNLISSSWIEFDHAGGIGEMPNRLISWDEEQGRSLKGFAFFDSDALLPGELSNQALIMVTECNRRNLPFHVLERRMIENYLPKKAIEMWVCSKEMPGPNTGDRRKRQVAFVKLNDAQRSHYNLKNGFNGDTPRIQRENRKSNVDALFSNVTAIERERLNNGLNRDIAKLFTIKLDQSWFMADKSSGEINNAISKILKYL